MSTPFIGDIRMFAGNFAPRGWLFCNGQLLPINQNQALFALLGTTYGGNGTTTFQLPNLQGRVPVDDGNGAGLPPVALGQAGGAENVTLTVAQMPVHTHQLNALSSAGTQAGPGGGVWASASPGRYSAGAPNVQMNPAAVGLAGSSQPHSNMIPYLAVSFIIALQGIFPSRN